MYDENSMKSHMFWIKFRRIFLLLVLTFIGTAIGVVISDYVVNILMFHQNFRIIIVSASALIFLSIAMLLTANTGKEIEDGYWKIAVYKKLAIISKKLDNLESNNSNKTSKSENKVNNENIVEKESKTIIEKNPEETPSTVQDIKETINELSDNLNLEETLPTTPEEEKNETTLKKEENV